MTAQDAITEHNTTGLILAGGAGRRVEGRDKGLMLWRNKTLVAHTVERIRPQVATLLISCNRNFDRYRAYADTLVADSRRDFQGPLAGLEAASPLIDTEFVFVCACDTPALPRDLVTRLAEPLNQANGRTIGISYAHDGTRDQYLCAVIRRSCLPSLPDYLDSGQRAVHKWFASQHCMAIDFSDAAGSFENFNQGPQLA